MSKEDNQQVDEEFEKLKNSKFKQQKLPAWRPVPTITSTSATFIIFGISFIIIGAVVLSYSNKVVEVSAQYNAVCNLNSVCTIKLQVNDTMTAPVMVYYQLDNFYQNHRRYVKSKSDSQLLGSILSVAQLNSSGECDPVVTMGDMGKTHAVDGTPLSPDTVANPCGLIAKSLFNDTYSLADSNGVSLFLNSSEVSWAADRSLKYARPVDPNYATTKNDNYWKSIQWTDVMDDHFMVWMRPAGLPNFRKLWARINNDIQPGVYTLTVNNNFNVSPFNGSKTFVLSTVNAFGGKNNFLGISYIVVGSICILMAIAFIIGYKIHSSKKEN